MTYAGFEAESKLLRDLYLQGVGREEHPDGQAERIHPTLPVYANKEARIFCYWDHQPRFPWQTPQYYAAQKRVLRAGAYRRFHLNEWSTSEETFITPELWDSCVDPGHRPLLPTQDTRVWIGVDASTKHDSSAVVGVFWQGEKLALAFHRIWFPTPEQPPDLEETIEAELRLLCRRYAVSKICFDPYQLHRSMVGLQSEGLPTEEYPQSLGNLTRAGQALFDLLKGRNIKLYPAGDLREQALQTISVTSGRGWRIAKERAGNKKIDAIVALSMGCVVAMDEGRMVAISVPSIEMEQLQAEGRSNGDDLMTQDYAPEQHRYQRLWGGGGLRPPLLSRRRPC